MTRQANPIGKAYEDEASNSTGKKDSDAAEEHKGIVCMGRA
jgi:hypothetical protein